MSHLLVLVLMVMVLCLLLLGKDHPDLAQSSEKAKEWKTVW
jgi:hypothetical protein